MGDGVRATGTAPDAGEERGVGAPAGIDDVSALPDAGDATGIDGELGRFTSVPRGKVLRRLPVGSRVDGGVGSGARGDGTAPGVCAGSAGEERVNGGALLGAANRGDE